MKIITLLFILALSGCAVLDEYARENQGDWGDSEQQVVRPDPIRPGSYTVKKK